MIFFKEKVKTNYENGKEIYNKILNKIVETESRGSKLVCVMLSRDEAELFNAYYCRKFLSRGLTERTTSVFINNIKVVLCQEIGPKDEEFYVQDGCESGVAIIDDLLNGIYKNSK